MNKPLVIAGIGYDVTEHIFPTSWNMDKIVCWFHTRNVSYAIFGCPYDKEHPFVFVSYY